MENKTKAQLKIPDTLDLKPFQTMLQEMKRRRAGEEKKAVWVTFYISKAFLLH